MVLRLLQRRLQGGAVLALEEGEAGFDAGMGLGRQLMDEGDLGRPVRLAGRGIVRPAAHLGDLARLAQHAFLMQAGLLRVLAFRHIPHRAHQQEGLSSGLVRDQLHALLHVPLLARGAHQAVGEGAGPVPGMQRGGQRLAKGHPVLRMHQSQEGIERDRLLPARLRLQAGDAAQLCRAEQRIVLTLAALPVAHARHALRGGQDGLVLQQLLRLPRQAALQAHLVQRGRHAGRQQQGHADHRGQGQIHIRTASAVRRQGGRRLRQGRRHRHQHQHKHHQHPGKALQPRAIREQAGAARAEVGKGRRRSGQTATARRCGEGGHKRKGASAV